MEDINFLIHFGNNSKKKPKLINILHTYYFMTTAELDEIVNKISNLY